MQTTHKADGFDAEKLLVLSASTLENITQHALIHPLYVTDIGFFPRAQNHYRERPEGCDTAIFIYCVEGEGWATLGNEQKLVIPTNTLLIIPEHMPHRYGAAETKPWSIYWFHLKGEAVGQFIQSFSCADSMLHVPPREGLKLVELFNQCYEILLYKGYALNHYLYVSQIMRHMLGSMALLRGEDQQDEQKNEYVERAIHYMFQHVQASTSLDELTQHVNLSKPHFIHLFKQVTGYSPIDYFMRLKIQRACQYLDLTDLSIKEVSKNVGIADPYYFSRVFHKIMRQSPTDYRKTKKG